MITNKKRTLRKINKLLILKIGVLAFSVITTLFLVREINNLISESVTKNDPRIEFYRSFIPLRKWAVEAPTINANGATVVVIDERGKKFLFDKNTNVGLPIASITKLMTVLVAMEEYDLDYKLVVSEEAFMKDLHRPNNLYPGETYKVRDLIHSSLMESNNTAAQALAEGRTIYNYDTKEEAFVFKMNKKADELGMDQTFFSNPSGLDPTTPGVSINRSSPKDLITLAEYLIDIPMIWEILSTEKYTLKTADGSFKYDMVNTNQLLGKMENLKGGKTGTTPRARETILAVFKRDDNIIITVILGSNTRFDDTKTLLDWIEDGYFWEVL